MNEQAILCYYNTLKETCCYDFLRPMVRRDVENILNSVPEITLENVTRKVTPSNALTLVSSPTVTSEAAPSNASPLVSSPTVTSESPPTNASTLLTPSAISDMETLLLERLHLLYTGILITRLNRQVEEYDFTQAIRPLPQPTAELQKAALDIKAELEINSRSNEDNCLTSEYPLLMPYLDRIRDNYRNYMQEVLSRFHAHRQELADRFFGGRIPKRIGQMSSSGADMHRKGRCVVRICTDVGDCFYKPHDCGLDEFYREITRKWFSDCTLAPDVIRGDGYAFVSPLVRRPLETEEAAARYYYHFGILTALLHGLGSNDIHGENVIPSGDLPCIVDLESIVSTEKKKKLPTKLPGETKTQDEIEAPGETKASGETTAPDDIKVSGETKAPDDIKVPGETKAPAETAPDPFQGIGASVLRLGILPVRLHKGGIISPLYQSELEVSPLPFCGDRTFTIEGYEPDLIRGFREGYQRMLQHREEILQMLDSHSGALVRIIPFNTIYYARSRGRLFSEDALRSEQAKEKVLSGLAIPFTWYGRETNQAQIAFEAAALKEGDIPYFCTTLSSRDLYATSLDELVQKDYLSLSAIEYTAKSLARLSTQDLVMEEELLKRSFIHAPLNVPVSKEERKWPSVIETLEEREWPSVIETPEEHERPSSMELPEKCDRPTTKKPREEHEQPPITTILHEITADRFYLTDGRAFWLSHAVTTRNQLGTLAQLAGVILYAARICSCPEYSAYFDEAGRLLRTSLKDMEIALKWLSRFDARSFRNQLSAGLGAGMGQVLYSLGTAKAGKLREQMLDLLMKNEIWKMEQPDLLEGLAGLLLGIIVGEPANPQPGIGYELANSCTKCLSHQPGIPHELILRCADRILHLPDPEEPDAFTGSAGIGFALAKAYAFTGQEAYAAGAANAFARVREAYSESQKGWLKSGGVMKWAAKRAPKAAGIGLCALEALMELDRQTNPDRRAEREELSQETHIAPPTTGPAADQTNLTQVIKEKSTLAVNIKEESTLPANIKEVLTLAVNSLLTEEHLYWNDSLYRGNALSVLFLDRAGAYLHRPDLQERAGQILTSMERRRKASGYYHLMEPGVRSTFDISFLEGTLGIGYAALELHAGANRSKPEQK